MQKRIKNQIKVSQKRDSQDNKQVSQKFEDSSDINQNYHPLENISCKIGDNACAAKHTSVIQRTGLFHPMNESQRVQSLLKLQQQYGNRFVQRVIAQNTIQTKLKIGQPGDIYEQEADNVAEQVMRMPEPQVQQQPMEEEELKTKPLAGQITPLVQRQPIEEEKEELQVKEIFSHTSEVTPNLETRINATRSDGQLLPASTRAFFEPRFDYRFSQARVHNNAEADNLNRALNSRAFNTSGLMRLEEETAQIKAEGTWVQRQAEEEEPGETEPTPETGEAETEETSAAGGLIEPVRIVRDKDLWWFDGEDAANYDEEAKLTAFGGRPGATRGTFRWDVVRGVGIVDFQNGSDSMTRVNANRIGIRSTDASTAMGDVRVRCRWSHGSTRRTLYHAFTVQAPDAGVVVSGPTDSVDPRAPAGSGFQTLYTIEVRNQFGTRLPRPIEVNEAFGAWSSDFAGEDWPEPAEVSDMSNASAQVRDRYAFTCPACTPPTVNPGAAGAGTAVQHATQRYRAGSLTAGDGRLIKTHTLQFYRGRARQE